MAIQEPITTAYVEDLRYEFNRTQGDARVFVIVMNQLLFVEKAFLEKSGKRMALVDRSQGGSRVVTHDLELLLDRADAQTHRITTSLKRAKEALKLSGL